MQSCQISIALLTCVLGRMILRLLLGALLSHAPSLHSSKLALRFMHHSGDSLGLRLRTVSSSLSQLSSPEMAERNGCEVHERDHARDHAICYDESSCGIARELQTESAVDDAENHQDTPSPDVNVAEDSCLAVLAVVRMMKPSENGLNAEQGHHGHAHDSVRIIKKLNSISIYDIGGTDKLSR